MINNLVVTLLGSVVFYIIYNRVYKIKKLNEYTEEAVANGIYDEKYKMLYSKHLNAQCISVTLTVIIYGVLSMFIYEVAMILAIVSGAVISLILTKYYPKP
ncbi:hypothetical protein CHL78_014290 [Romboutsia weinsteinii]|uniref:DUF3784 domain-containing protein n=1 Tax=Romboutsia weinsteinii TaxID=2020949 RepID=A0A371J0M7_9FIRM|nr:hypothetical protein [Romboutsia weinsteinii]RDY26263.1 hypothetical protein CHL78_014290 [Romboutsia weinsteinii]